MLGPDSESHMKRNEPICNSGTEHSKAEQSRAEYWLKNRTLTAKARESMAPIPRCDLRLPSEARGKRSSEQPGSAKAKTTVRKEAAVAAAEEEEEEEEMAEDTEDVPEAAHSAHRKDTAESIEQAGEFSTRLTRDMAEIREHKMAEDEEGAGVSGSTADVCEKLAQCRFEPEDGDSAQPAPPFACELEKLGTPGDTCAKFSQDRAESPFEDTEVGAGGPQRKRQGPAAIQDRSQCKNTYRSTIQYESLLGSVNAMATRKKQELEMKVKRKYYERLYAKLRARRARERRRAAAKRRALRCRDQSKIPDTKDDIFVNKAFCFRLNYNRRLPYMPSAMNQHLQKFNKPPFKHFHKGFQACNKQVDEFEKLRQADVKKQQPKQMAKQTAKAPKQMIKQAAKA